MGKKDKKRFAPGTFGFHEFVDRAYLIAELFSWELAQHPGAKHSELKARVKTIERELYQLYSDAASIHADGVPSGL